MYFQPVITSITPSSARVGDEITITGLRFGPTDELASVTLNGVVCPVTSWSDTVVKVIVPSTTSGTLTLTSRTNNVKDYGAVGSGAVDDTSAIQDAIDDLPVGSSKLYFPAGDYLTGNLVLDNQSDLTVKGDSAKLLLTGTAPGTDNIGIQSTGTSTNVTIQDLEIEGDGVLANRHAGVWNNSGVDFTNFTVKDCNVHDTIVGIIVNADLTGAIDGFLVDGNTITDIIGTTSGHGYGILHANGSGNPSNGVISNNTLTRCHRHDIYQGKGSYVTISGNTSIDHRLGEAPESYPLGALVLGRSHHIDFDNNTIIGAQDGCFMVMGESTIDSHDITVTNNTITDPVGSYPSINIGYTTPSTEGLTTDILIEGNTLTQDATGQPPITIWSGKRITVQNNDFTITNCAAAYGMFAEIRGMEETAGTALYSDDIVFTGNTLSGTKTGGLLYGFEICTATCTSAVDVDITGNFIGIPDATYFFDVACTDPNLTLIPNWTIGGTIPTPGSIGGEIFYMDGTAAIKNTITNTAATTGGTPTTATVLGVTAPKVGAAWYTRCSWDSAAEGFVAGADLSLVLAVNTAWTGASVTDHQLFDSKSGTNDGIYIDHNAAGHFLRLLTFKTGDATVKFMDINAANWAAGTHIIIATVEADNTLRIFLDGVEGTNHSANDYGREGSLAANTGMGSLVAYAANFLEGAILCAAYDRILTDNEIQAISSYTDWDDVL